ncbi:hypothetical protein [Streptomyces sp. 1222.5]|uniref:hypothetical protein n=1 Tax=Streptomyces sp. 1222.5 TaxID=1881026 RepID=UPI003D7268D8
MPLLVDMGWGGVVQLPATITWTDVSDYVNVAQGVTITRGAADEMSETQPGTATLTFDNSDGRFTPNNSASPYYPYVRRNAPIRIAVALTPTRSGSAPYLLEQLGDDFDDNRVNTTLWPNNYGGSSEVGGRMRLPVGVGVTSGFQTAREWTLTGSKLVAKLVTLPGVNGSSSAVTSMWVNSTTSGTRLGWRYNAVTNQISAESQVGFSDATPFAYTYSPISHAWLRVRENGGATVWEASGDGYTWTNLRSTATPAWVGSGPVAVEFAATRTGGTADYAEWDLVGATVKPRFYGVVNEWPVEWEGLTSTVQVSCTDLFKQLNRQPSLRSMAAQEVLASNPGPVVFYPLTEDSAATSVGDIAGTGAGSLAITQAGTGGSLTMASATGPAETGESYPAFAPSSATNGKYLAGDMGAAVEEVLTENWPVFEAWFQTSTTGRAIMGLASADWHDVHVLSIGASGGLQIEWTTDGNSTLTVEPLSGPTTFANGAWHHVVYDQYTGSVWADGVLIDSAIAVVYGYHQRILHIGGYRGTRLWNGAIAGVAMYGAFSSVGADIATHYTAGTTGYSGETADDRIERLSRYAQIASVTVQGTVHDPIASQGPAGSTALARMREVESTESARLFASRSTYGLVYQSRGLRYNPAPSGEAFTVAYADLETRQSQLADDDQKLVNDVTGSRPGGATQRVTAPASVLAFGSYPQDLSILKTSDNSVLDAAYWLVSRYADPAPELREVPVEAYTLNYSAVLDADISSYFSVTAMPAQAPASSMRVTIEGYTETIREKSHVIQFHTSATTTDSVWVLDDPVYSVLSSTTRLAY